MTRVAALGVAEGGGQHVPEGGAGPLERILAVVRQVLHRGDHGGVQDLQHDRGQTGLRHRRQVGVDLPRDAVGSEQARVTGRPAVDRRIIVASGALLEVGHDAAAQLLVRM